MQTQLQKWGNSLGLRIPKEMANQLHLHSGSPVSIEVENGRIIIQGPKYDLDTMLNAMTSENRHNQIFDDTRRGKEEW